MAVINFDILEFHFKKKKYLKINLFEFNPKINFLSQSLVINYEMLKHVYSLFNKYLSEPSKNQNQNILKIASQFNQLIIHSEFSKISDIFMHLFRKKTPLFILVYSKNSLILNFPFEIIKHPKKDIHLSLARPILRSTHSIQKVKKSKKKKNSFLIIADPKANLQYAYQEGLQIYEYLHNNVSYHFDKLTFISQAIKKSNMLELFEEYDWIHYAGHGNYNKVFKNNELHIHPNEILNTHDLKLLYSPPQFIFFNACNIGHEGSDIKKSFIYQLLNLGTQNIIASNRKIIDNKNYIQFILFFYKKVLLENLSFQDALLKMIKYSFKKEQLLWLYFRFYQAIQ